MPLEAPVIKTRCGVLSAGLFEIANFKADQGCWAVLSLRTLAMM